MTGLTEYWRHSLLNHALRNIAAPSGRVWAGVCKPDLSEVGTPTVSGYTRQLVTFAAPVNGSIANSAALVIPLPFTLPGGTALSSVSLHDASSGGNVLAHCSFDTAGFGAGDTVDVDVGALTVSLRTPADTLKTAAWCNSLLDHYLRATATPPALLYGGLWGWIAVNGSGTAGELGSPGAWSYARQLLEFNAPSGGKVVNTNEELVTLSANFFQDFFQNFTSIGAGIGLHTAENAGTMVAVAQITAIVMQGGNQIELPPGSLEVTF